MMSELSAQKIRFNGTYVLTDARGVSDIQLQLNAQDKHCWWLTNSGILDKSAYV
jgi:hypothetical protein